MRQTSMIPDLVNTIKTSMFQYSVDMEKIQRFNKNENIFEH